MRQSSAHQVLHISESSALQYAMQTAWTEKINMSKASSKVGKIARPNANRRQFIAGTSAAFLLGLQKPARAESVLNVLTWPGHGDQEFVAPFEKQYGVKVGVRNTSGASRCLPCSIRHRPEPMTRS